MRWAVGASLALHLVLAWTLPARRQSRVRANAIEEVTFEIVAGVAVAHEPRVATEVEAPPQALEQRAAREGPMRPPRSGRTEALAVVRVDPPALDTAADASAVRVEAVETARVDLSPRAVARHARDSLGTRSCDELRTDAGTACGDDEGQLAQLANQRLEAALDRAASGGASTKVDAEPKLVRQSDGSYRFDGMGFVARIGRDGAVDFEDRPVVQVAPIPIGGTFDLMDAIEGGILGRELHATEKRWFLKQTASLRAELVERELERARTAGRASIEDALARIARDVSRPLAARHADIFALWDDCAADEHGTEAQQLIERFVRRAMPEGSAGAFTREELEALNRTRASARRFDPYRAADAGTQPG